MYLALTIIFAIAKIRADTLCPPKSSDVIFENAPPCPPPPGLTDLIRELQAELGITDKQIRVSHRSIDELIDEANQLTEEQLYKRDQSLLHRLTTNMDHLLDSLEKSIIARTSKTGPTSEAYRAFLFDSLHPKVCNNHYTDPGTTTNTAPERHRDQTHPSPVISTATQLAHVSRFTLRAADGVHSLKVTHDHAPSITLYIHEGTQPAHIYIPDALKKIIIHPDDPQDPPPAENFATVKRTRYRKNNYHVHVVPTSDYYLVDDYGANVKLFMAENLKDGDTVLIKDTEGRTLFTSSVIRYRVKNDSNYVHLELQRVL